MKIIGIITNKSSEEVYKRASGRIEKKKIQEVPLYSGPVTMLAPWANSTIALLSANSKPPVELLVAELEPQNIFDK